MKKTEETLIVTASFNYPLRIRVALPLDRSKSYTAISAEADNMLAKYMEDHAHTILRDAHISLEVIETNKVPRMMIDEDPRD